MSLGFLMPAKAIFVPLMNDRGLDKYLAKDLSSQTSPLFPAFFIALENLYLEATPAFRPYIPWRLGPIRCLFSTRV